MEQEYKTFNIDVNCRFEVFARTYEEALSKLASTLSIESTGDVTQCTYYETFCADELRQDNFY